MAAPNNRSVEAVDDAISVLRRLRTTLENSPTTAAASAPAPAKGSEAFVEGQTWGSPVLGFMRTTVGFGDGHRFTYWSFNFWKFSFAIHIPRSKKSESGNDELAQWFDIERQAVFETTLMDLIKKKRRKEAIELVRVTLNKGTKEAMEFVDQRSTNSALAGEHLSKLDQSVKTSDRINEEYKEMHGDKPLQAR